MPSLDANGLTIDTASEILADIEQREIANIDADIDPSNDFIINTINSIVSDSLSEVQELAQEIYAQSSVTMAEGVNLDYIAAEVGISRRPATPSSTTDQRYTGNEGTIIEPTVIIGSSISTERASPATAFSLLTTACVSTTFGFNPILTNNYTITINTQVFTVNYTGGGANKIANDLATAINGFSPDYKAEVTDDGTGDFLIVSEDAATNISIIYGAEIFTTSVTSRALTRLSTTGSISVPENTMTQIVVGTAGLVSTTNGSVYTLGSDIESDEELRARILASGAIRGKATVDNIKSAVLAVSGVESASVRENDTFTTVNGVPAKAFEVFVVGGANNDIAQAIHDTKAAGIQDFGDESGIAINRDNEELVYFFSRPGSTNIAVRVTYFISGPNPPSNIEEAIENVVLEYFSGLDVNQSITPSELYCPLYAGVNDISYQLIELSNNLAAPGDAPSNWSSTLTRTPDTDTVFTTTTQDIYVLSAS